MTDKEKLEKVRAEIERRFEIYLTGARTTFRNGKREALRDIISFIDSLQEEPQVKESAKTQHDNETYKENDDSLTRESVSKDLEGEIKRYLHEVYDRDNTVSDVARHFAEWQKQQMTKEAVNGTFLFGELADGTHIDAIFISDKVVRNKYEKGEKVKVWVIKED